MTFSRKALRFGPAFSARDAGLHVPTFERLTREIAPELHVSHQVDAGPGQSAPPPLRPMPWCWRRPRWRRWQRNSQTAASRCSAAPGSACPRRGNAARIALGVGSVGR